MISRENYEIWFINYLDGQLNPQEVEILGAFLNQNPALREELKEVRSFHLVPDEATFPGKELLLKDEAVEMGIGRGDFLLVKQLEDAFSDPEASELAELMGADASLAKGVMIYPQLKLQPASVIFPRTRSLLRPKVVVAHRWRRFAAAAAVLLLLFTGWQWFRNSPNVPVEHLTGLVPREVPVLQPRSGAIAVTPAVPLLKNPGYATPALPVNHTPQATGSQTKRESSPPLLPMASLPSKGISKIALASVAPNAFELGLNSMMPLFLELNNQNQILPQTTTLAPSTPKDNLLIRGLQLIDKVTGEIIQFNKIYNEEGTYVAYHLQTPVFKIENRLDKGVKN